MTLAANAIANWTDGVDGATLNATFTTAASYEAASSKVRLCCIAWASIGVTSTPAPSLSGGVTWAGVALNGGAPIYIEHSSGEKYLSIFRSKGTGASAPLVFTAGNGQTFRYLRMMTFDFDDIDLTGSDGAGAIAQAISDNTLATATPSINITVVSSSNGLLAFFARYGGNTAFTAGTGYTEIGDSPATNLSAAVEFRSTTDTNADGTFAAGGTPPVNGIVLELKPGAASSGLSAGLLQLLMGDD